MVRKVLKYLLNVINSIADIAVVRSLVIYEVSAAPGQDIGTIPGGENERGTCAGTH